MAQSEAEHAKLVIDALDKYRAGKAVPDDSASFQAMLFKESDRGLVIILVSYIEDALVERVCTKLPKGKAVRKLLKAGPMRNFEHQISFALATGVLTEMQAEMLTVFRHMRNACAHCGSEISFDTPELRETFALAVIGQARDLIMNPPEGVDVRGLFQLTASSTLLHLLGLSEEEQQALMDEHVKEMAARGQPGLIQTEHVLFEALRRTRTSKPNPGPLPHPNGSGR